MCVGPGGVGAGGVLVWVGGRNSGAAVLLSLTATNFHANLFYSSLRLTIEYLNHSWGVGPNTFRGWEKKAAAAAKAALEPPVKESPYDKNVIVNRSLAQARFTGKYLFALYHRQLASSVDTFHAEQGALERVGLRLPASIDFDDFSMPCFRPSTRSIATSGRKGRKGGENDRSRRLGERDRRRRDDSGP